MQQTLAKHVSIVGTGLHSGVPVRLTLCPAKADHGLTFVRTDIVETDNVIAVTPENWVEASLCTVLQNDAGASVSTIEHLMAALHGCGVHNLRIEIDGPEVPILDGSAAPFVARILAAGLVQCDAPVRVVRVLRPVTVECNGARASLLPADGLELTFEIDFADEAIGFQRQSLEMYNGAFLRELSDCRTFCMRADVEVMQANGLALGGTLDNAVVFDSGAVLTPGGLRRADEPVRHKMLDAMGDLYVAGHSIIGRYEGIKAGHALTGKLLQALFSDPENYEIVPCEAHNVARLPGANLSEKDMPLSA
ncbi:UDP-3-O-acyl-N-acetylglucosamine deacetylase [Roseinatronobacter sp.]|uniref:UDP-3-O-acyl-N-acetylglucosamine deacetylase n=1 Tax=Roseinatronobacter sp. TaxID=1945755 RepID=UPI003F71FF79